MNASVNSERTLLTISGSFGGMEKDFVKVAVRFPSINQDEFICDIETIQNDRLDQFIFKTEIEILRF